MVATSARAAFILSLDTEIAWGTYNEVGKRADAFDGYTLLLRRLLTQLDIYEVPATWALVGGLLDPDAAENVTPVRYRFASAPDATRTAAYPRGWVYMPHAPQMIRGGRVRHEIGTHTHTHLLADDPAVTEAVFREQLAAVVQVHTAHELPPPRSLVYPQDRVAYTHTLRDYGIVAYRGRAQDWYQPLPPPLRRPAHLLDRAVALPPPTYRPTDGLTTDGVVNIPASQFLMSYDGVRARIPTEARVRQAARGIAQAVERDEVFHLWFHPFNLGSSEAMLDALTQILTMVWEAREAGKLRTLTMGGLADEVLATQH